MRRQFFVLLAVLLFMVACVSVENDMVSHKSYGASSSVDLEVPSPSIYTAKPMPSPESRADENVLIFDADAPHPFAEALREYMENYIGIIHANLVTLDDDGKVGVLVSRTPTLEFSEYWEEYVFVRPGTLFFIQDGELFQFETLDFFVSGRYNRLMGRYSRHTYMVEVVFKLESGRLEDSTRLEYFSDEYLSILFDNYDVVAEFIAERDARAEYAREKYGLVALLPPLHGHMRNTQDQTEQILAMTVDCAPSFDAATTVPTDQLSVTIGDTPVNFVSGQPILVGGHLLVPVEFFDVLGFGVSWHPQTQEFRLGPIIIALNSNVFITAGSKVGYIPDMPTHLADNRTLVPIYTLFELDIPAQVIDGITMIPIRATLESMGYDVNWDEATQTVIITNSN